MFTTWTPNDGYNVLVAQMTGVLFVVWAGLYYISYPLSSLFCKKTFARLSAYEKYEWCSRVVSTVHAIVGVGFALYTLLLENELNKQKLPIPERMSIGVALTASATLSYWVYDLILIFSYWSKNKDYAMLAHHLSGILPFGLGSYYQEFMIFAPTIVLAESSTPFVNARWFMYVSGNQTTIWYAANGLMMWLSFLFCRILWLPYGLYDLIENFSPYLNNYHSMVLIPIVVGTPIAYALSCYWFALITKGLLKVALSLISKKPSSTPQSSSSKSKTH